MELAFLTKVGNHDYTKKPVAKCFQLVLIGAKGPHPQHVLTVRALRPLSSRRDEECSSVSFGNTWNQEDKEVNPDKHLRNNLQSRRHLGLRLR